MTKVWKINTKRKDTASHMRCKICKGIPTRWYKLMSTTIYRCEKHKKEIASPVYDQGKISTRGELIGMESNPTFEVGISKVSEYMDKSKVKLDTKGIEALNKELYNCKYCPNYKIDMSDSNYEQKVKDLVSVHIRSEHPILFSISTYYDEKGEHNLYLEHPEEFHLTQISCDEITEHFTKAIPKEFVGTDVSAGGM